MLKPYIMGFYLRTMAFEQRKVTIFASEMKRTALILTYWSMALILFAIVLSSTGYSFANALFLASSLLPIARIAGFVFPHAIYPNAGLARHSSRTYYYSSASQSGGHRPERSSHITQSRFLAGYAFAHCHRRLLLRAND